ncbi:unnamed protein product [Onchocerca ochengi]|uniref:Major sperm protein n=2 Tax=Onchocerca TaxID=6281 RepID=A0A182E860_ONCOC|nr:unnamed protein product [Onchocerca ochengi]
MTTFETKPSISSLSSVPTNILPIYITIEPKQLTFQDDSEMSNALLRIINISHLRVAFRIRTNAPTQYVVMPSAGFLSANESVNVLITNLNIRQYHRRHRFIIQAMKAKESDKNRREIWDDLKAENLNLVQCIRLSTLKVSKKRSEESRNDKCNQLTISPKSETDKSISEIKSLQGQIMTDEEIMSKINELNKQINNKLEEKRKEYQNLMQAINEVKMIEIDLDQATIQCNDLNKAIISEENEQKIIEDKLAKIDAILNTLKTEMKI